jgi:receptor protein-tyrosine kinase
MPDRQRAEGMDISAFFGVLRRRILIVAVVVVGAAAGAYFVSKSQDPEYTATTELLLKGTPSGTAVSSTGPIFSPPLPAAAPDRESLVTRNEVLDRTERGLAQRIGQARAADAVAGLTAFSGEDQDIVELRATASRPGDAALAANTLAQSNVEFRKGETLREIDRAERAGRAELARQGPYTVANSAAVARIQQELSTLRGARSTADGGAEVVERATTPSSPSSPKPKRSAIIGAFGGLLVGLALALVREQLDRRVRHSQQLEEVFGLPVLASVPKSRALGGQNEKALEQLPAGDAEAFQLLRANLRFLNTDRELRSVVITSASAGDGKSTVALNLAKADAAVGKKVLLVEADVRRPRLAGLLGLQSTTGLTAFLSDPSMPLADVTHRVPVGQRQNGAGSANTLDVMVAGSVPDNPSELINSERMRDLIREAEASYDLVVLDTPPASMVADSIPLMREATAVIIVGRVGRITSSDANALREQLERIDAPAYGLVANFAPRTGSYGYY